MTRTANPNMRRHAQMAAVPISASTPCVLAARSEAQSLPAVDLWTDGSCPKNPGTGGWAAILVSGEFEKVLSGAARTTTNNRMELTAILEGIRALTEPCLVTVHSDSQLAIRWLEGRYAIRQPEIRPLVDAVRRAIASGRHRVCYEWVKGHAGNRYNELCDLVARQAVDAFDPQKCRGFESGDGA